MARLIVLIALAACEWNHVGPKTDASTKQDGRRLVDAAGHEDHVVLSEIALTPVGGEFIEIKNSTSKAVDLTNYYLSDNGNYFSLPVAAPVVSTTDFIVQFPADSLPAGGVITVAIGTAATFMTTYAKAPSYSIADSTVMHTVVPGTPTLTDAGEVVVLFRWDGSADLVTDVDIMIAGAATAQNVLVSKSGVMQGTSTYATDAETIAPQATAPGAGFSTKRIADETGNETQDGTGNGTSGDDETSEDTSVTWDTTYTAPNPGI